MRRIGAGLENAGPLIAWCLGAIIVAFTLASGILASVTSTAEVPWKSLIVGLVWAVPGVLIAAGRPRIAVGWLLLASAVIFAAMGVASEWVAFASEIGMTNGVDWAAWFTDRFGAALVPVMFLALFLLPDGRFPLRAWKGLAFVVVGVQAATVMAWALLRGPAAAPDSELPGTVRNLPNPVGVLPESVAGTLIGLEPYVLQLSLLLLPIAFAFRLWKARGADRRRIASILLAATAFVLLLVIGRALWPPVAEAIDIAAGIFLAVVVTAAVLQRRLAGVEVVVHHAVLFTVLTVAIAGTYALAVTVAAVFSQELPPFGVGIIAALVAFAALPLRGWLQLLVDRLLYGHRNEPYEALRDLAERTHDAPSLSVLLNELASTIASSLKVPWAAVALNDLVVTAGRRPPGSREIQAPLLSQGHQIGTVSAAAGPGRTLRRREVALLSALGRHGGMAVQAMVLADAVAASRQRVIIGREEERRALSRDLHDELGPTMASISMQLGTLRRIVNTDPQTAEDRLGQLELAAQDALSSVRNLAKGLRPTVLDELGLEAALRRSADNLGIDLRMPVAELPPLPAAVEVAAYRIATEALTNVVRHAGTVRAEVTASVSDGSLTLAVADDGRGIEEHFAKGVGIVGMRERAEELGGTLSIVTDDQGTTVTATLPSQLEPTGASA